MTPEEWEVLESSLREGPDCLKSLIQNTTEWSNEQQWTGAMATIVHTADHLGGIRRALSTVWP